MTLRLGSLCTGYGGLDMAIAQVLDVEPAWVADPDPGAAAILAHHYPGVPNLGDITATDWATVPPIDVLAAGFPCQDISYAGLGAGIKEGTRSGLWHTIAAAISVVRPGLVVLENVRGIVARRPGLDVVLAELARLGFDASWCCVRASDVGAPHPRQRWFLVAEDTDRSARGERRVAAPGQAEGGRARPDTGRRGGAPAPDAACLGCPDEPRNDRAGFVLAEPGAGDGDRPGRDASGAGRPGDGAGVVAWGPYASAIHRWESVLGRPAPRPTEPGRNGERLSPRFVEWLMGLDDGHVIAVPGLSRNQQLKALGNGVVPQQGAAAVEHLLDRAAQDRPEQESAA